MKNEKQNPTVCCHDGLKRISMVAAFILMIALIIMVVFLSRNLYKSYDYVGVSDEMRNQITISGEADVVAVPDVARVSLTVITDGQSVSAAQEQNTQKMNDVIDSLKDFDIDKKDIKTTSYNISPQYDWTDSGRVFKGYQIYQQVKVTIREVDKVGAILSAAGQLQVDSVGNLTFEVDDIDAVEQEARIQAIANAREKAEELADSLDVKLGKIISFSESSYAPSVDYIGYAKSEALGINDEIEEPIIEVGESEISANVTITFELL